FGGQVPPSFQGFPPLKLMLVESLNLAVVSVGAVRSRNRVGGLAVAPAPCRKKSALLCASAGVALRMPASRKLNARRECRSVNRRGVRRDDETTSATCMRGCTANRCHPVRR